MEGNSNLWIHNAYNPSPQGQQARVSVIGAVKKALKLDGEHVLLGGFNLHHPLWNNEGRIDVHEEAHTLLECVRARGPVFP